MTNSKIRPQKIWGIPADFAYIATSDFENWPKLYFTAKLAQFGLEMIIRPFLQNFEKKLTPILPFRESENFIVLFFQENFSLVFWCWPLIFFQRVLTFNVLKTPPWHYYFRCWITIFALFFLFFKGCPNSQKHFLSVDPTKNRKKIVFQLLKQWSHGCV